MDARERVLVVATAGAIRVGVAGLLDCAGFRVECVDEAAKARKRLKRSRFALVVVDLVDLGPDGVRDVVGRRRRGHVPTLALTSYCPREDESLAFRGGADDYLLAPYRAAELLHRVRALTERFRPRVESQAPRLDLDIDVDQQVVRRHGVVVPITKREWRVLLALASKPRRVWQHDELARAAGLPGRNSRQLSESLRAVVHRLRRKLEPIPSRPRYLLTSRGSGYVLSRLTTPPTPNRLDLWPGSTAPIAPRSRNSA